MQRTKEFLITVLSFEVSLETPEYVILSRDGHDLHLCPAVDTPSQMSAYLEVDSLESAWAHFSSTNTEGIKIREPFQQAYGMKEFHVILPKTKTLLLIGEKM
ncbi:MAG: hypothetical protein ACSHX9_11350 [Luteolibacter sp.]